MSEALGLKNICKSYKQGGKTLNVLEGLSLSIEQGQAVALVGPSGSGKTTLLHIAGLLDSPDSGAIVIAGVDASKANESQRTKLRRDSIGFVYQFHNLLSDFTACENVAMPLLLRGVAFAEANKMACELLEKVGIADRISHKPAQLSGGEQQRVAIARALIHSPKLIIADEPTGNLDAKTAEVVFELLINQCKTSKTAILMATHNLEIAGKMSKTLKLASGVIS